MRRRDSDNPSTGSSGNFRKVQAGLPVIGGPLQTRGRCSSCRYKFYADTSSSRAALSSLHTYYVTHQSLRHKKALIKYPSFTPSHEYFVTCRGFTLSLAKILATCSNTSLLDILSYLFSFCICFTYFDGKISIFICSCISFHWKQSKPQKVKLSYFSKRGFRCFN